MSLDPDTRRSLEDLAACQGDAAAALAEIDRLTAALAEAEVDIANWKRLFESATVRLGEAPGGR